MTIDNICMLKKNIRRLMEDTHTSQEELAKAIGTSQSNLSKALNPEDDSRRLTLEQLFDIAEHFKVSIDSLFERDVNYANQKSLKSIADLIKTFYESGDIKIASATIPEVEYLSSYDGVSGYTSRIEENHIIDYPTIYFPEFWKPEDFAENEDDYYSLFSEIDAIGNRTRYAPLNAFIKELTNVNRLCRDKQISPDSYDFLTDSLINQLADK